MTSQKHLKQLVRARMQKTGERYSTARRQVISAATPVGTASSHPAATATIPPAVGSHLAGNVAATTALRVLLTHAGVRDLSEATTFVLAGGIGAGVFAFLYEKEDFASSRSLAPPPPNSATRSRNSCSESIRPSWTQWRS